jgi:hypothetical protein
VLQLPADPLKAESFIQDERRALKSDAFSAPDGILARRSFRYRPNAGQWHLWISRMHPIASEAVGLLDQIEFVHHGSSSCSPSVCARSERVRAQFGRAWRDGLLVREGESGLQFQRLTRSIHGSRVVKSGEEIVDSQASGGFQSAHRSTGKNSRYSGVLVRIRCS